jgi:hypothetical protein
MKKILTHLSIICLLCLTQWKAFAQCENFHVSIISHDNCAIAGDKTNTVNETGGTAPYSYLWINTNTNAYVTGTTNINTSGVSHAYAVVTDANGCRDTATGNWYPDIASCTIIFPPSTISPTCVNFNIIVTKNEGLLNNDIIYTGTPSMGVGPYNYSWYGYNAGVYTSGTFTGASCSTTPVGNGNFFMAVTDANGCVARDSFYSKDFKDCKPCDIDSLSLNTGIDNAGNVLAGGAMDNHWVITSLPSTPSTYIAPLVITSPDIAWDSIASTKAKWINHDDAGPNSFQFNLHTFTRKIKVCQSGTFLINFKALADNDVQVYIDGTLMASSTGALVGWTTTAGASVTNYNVTLAHGLHKIDAVVNNVGNTQGLWMEGSIKPGLINPGILVPDTCSSPVTSNNNCNVVTDDFNVPAFWTHPVLLPSVALAPYYNTLNIAGGQFKFLQSRDNNMNYYYRNVGAIDDNYFTAKIDFTQQTTVPGWGVAHTILGLTSAPLPFNSDPVLSIGGSPGSSTPLLLTPSVMDGISVSIESAATASVTSSDFKIYIKDNGVRTQVGTPVNVAANTSSYLTLERFGALCKLTVYSDALRTIPIGNTGWAAVPNTINTLNHVIIGTMEEFVNDRMLTGHVDNLCISNGVTVGLNSNVKPYVTVNLFPNPADEYLTLKCNAIIEGIEILNTNAQVVQTEIYNTTEARIKIEDLTPGMYFIKIKTAQGSVTRRFVK